MRVRTGYSFRHSFGHLHEVASRLKEIGATAAPISDRASTFGWVRWSKEAKKAGLRPVFGVELAVSDYPADLPPDERPKGRPRLSYWTFFAKDSVEVINRLVRLATKQAYYEPMLTYRQATEVKGVLRVVDNLADFTQFAPHDDTFVALAPSSARAYIAEAKAAGFKLIASSDNNYPRREDRAAYEVAIGRNAVRQTYPQWLLSLEEWRTAVKNRFALPQWIEEAEAAVEPSLALLNAQLPVAEIYKPERPKSLRHMCEEGAAALGVDLSNPIYQARLDRELELIATKQFEDYFYIIADMMAFARQNMICGPARGSSCGSLVCYLLRITTIDPIKYGLIFERFIDITRADLPDIDLDFSDQQRDLIFGYMRDKYGKDHVARLGTVAVYKPRSAISEAGAALNVPKWRLEAVLESIIKRSSGDARALQAVEDTFKDTSAGRELIEKHPEMAICQRLEGHPRHYSQHAAGIILTSEPVERYVAVDDRTGATMCDKKDAEDLGMLKIDALGLTQLSVFEDTLAMAGLPRDHLETVPLDDQRAFDVLNEQKWSGVFQFNGMALQSLAKQVRITELEDIITITALARPGPLNSGGAQRWVDRRNGKEPVTYPHPLFEPYLSGTRGVVIYQEQVMEIGRNIGGLSWEDVTALRKAMSKSMGKEFFDQYGDRWKAGARAKGIPSGVLDKIWDELCAYGSWAFNRSHSVAYGIVSYWCCWLKAHYPEEFAAATLSHESDPDRQVKTLREITAEGIDYVAVDPETSGMRWGVTVRNGKKVLAGPLTAVKGIGLVNAEKFLEARKLAGGWKNLLSIAQSGQKKVVDKITRTEISVPTRVINLLTNPVTDIDSLWPIRDAFMRVMPDPAARNILTRPTPIAQINSEDEGKEYLVFCILTKINPRDGNEVVNVQRRGYAFEGEPSLYLNLHLTDDTDTIFGRVDRWKYDALAKPIIDRGGPGKHLYAIKGRLLGGSGFRLLQISNVRYIGERK
jgi:DNA polymerase III alpha subunit